MRLKTRRVGKRPHLRRGGPILRRPKLSAAGLLAVPHAPLSASPSLRRVKLIRCKSFTLNAFSLGYELVLPAAVRRANRRGRAAAVASVVDGALCEHQRIRDTHRYIVILHNPKSDAVCRV